MGKVYNYFKRVIAVFALLIGTGNSLKAQGNQLNFDGVDGQVIIYAVTPQTEYTIEFWFRTIFGGAYSFLSDSAS